MLPGFNQYCRELMCIAQGHNMVPLVGIEPGTSRFGSPMLNHYATALPKMMILRKFHDLFYGIVTFIQSYKKSLMPKDVP